MPLHVTAWEVCVRLLLAIVAGSVVGLNRSEHGQPAGMRTTILVCLAAALSMVLANLLLDQRGKPADSFVVLDLMRLPLGILSGIGFIGAGAIFKHGKLVRGVTTAATLWFVTVIGLCIGTGFLALGMGSVVIAWVVLAGIKRLEKFVPQLQTVTLTVQSDQPLEEDLRRHIHSAGHRVVKWAVSYEPSRERQTIRCVLRRKSPSDETAVPDYVQTLAQAPGVIAVRWNG